MFWNAAACKSAHALPSSSPTSMGSAAISAEMWRIVERRTDVRLLHSIRGSRPKPICIHIHTVPWRLSLCGGTSKSFGVETFRFEFDSAESEVITASKLAELTASLLRFEPPHIFCLIWQRHRFRTRACADCQL